MSDETSEAIVDLASQLSGRLVPRDLNKAMRRYLVPSEVQRWIRSMLRQPGSRLQEASELESHIAEIVTCLDEFEEKFPAVAMFLYLLGYEAHRNGTSCLDKSGYFKAKLTLLGRRVGIDQSAVERCFSDGTERSAAG